MECLASVSRLKDGERLVRNHSEKEDVSGVEVLLGVECVLNYSSFRRTPGVQRIFDLVSHTRVRSTHE